MGAPMIVVAQQFHRNWTMKADNVVDHATPDSVPVSARVPGPCFRVACQ